MTRLIAPPASRYAGLPKAQLRARRRDIVEALDYWHREIRVIDMELTRLEPLPWPESQPVTGKQLRRVG